MSAAFRRKLLQERDDALRDDRNKARFLSFRLNLESTDESSMLLTVQDWKRVEARALGPNDDAPIIGIDLGGGRSWSSAVALWRSGRVEAFAVAARAARYRSPRAARFGPSGDVFESVF